MTRFNLADGWHFNVYKQLLHNLKVEELKRFSGCKKYNYVL